MTEAPASAMTTVWPDLGAAEGVQEYQYEPLIAADAVRVLVVHPADKFGDPLRCSIVHYVLSAEISSDDYCSHQHYSAVSYTWGSAVSSHQLLVARPLVPGNSGAASACRYLRITANVDSLLRHLRKAHKAVRLWIDAVYLNQADEKEKAQQIHKMGDIYRAAKKVHIWLGDDNVDDARRVFSLIRQVELRNEWSPSQDEVSLLAKLFARAWFARLWVIQEAVLAHEAVLHCESDSLPLSWMLLALKKVQSSTAGLEVLGYGPKMLLSSVAKYQEAPDRCKCSDPRDRIAALYGLASSTDRQPDLRYNEGAAQVYWDCASYFINRDPVSAHMLILHLAEFGSLRAIPQAGEPPSWVPDWSRSRRPVLPSLDAL
ncbi:heterokaryon incompatibility protein-domain-containing protein [Diaporthe sp. PMI_573]|nr:heterokaryon incompatibility protein-domain-containing protein [Diaporthaceae sp. PMI_573]